MSKGSTFPPERRLVAREPFPVWQLTNYLGHSHHLYFTNDGAYADGTRLLFVSDRGNRSNLFSLSFEDWSIRQLTDLPPRTAHDSLQFTSLNPVRPEAYFWTDGHLIALDLDTLVERKIFTTPQGFANNMTSVTADGRHICTAYYKDLSAQFSVDLLRGYVGFEEYWQARPLSCIVLIDTETGAARTVFEEDYWIGHVNASPTRPSALTFCHEGPSRKIDNRIWGLDTGSGRHWPLRQRKGPDERITHEYWLADGERVAFLTLSDSTGPTFGAAAFEGDTITEWTVPKSAQSMHFHSVDDTLIVGDGNARDRWLMLLSRDANGFGEPLRLFAHNGTSNVQATHVHPRLSRDKNTVVFVSDRTGYGNIYLAEIVDRVI